MIRLGLLLAALSVCCFAKHFDEDVPYEPDDYDDVWEGISMEEFKHQKHHFVHKNVKPTEPVDEGSENYLTRLRRETHETEDIYDDSWMNRMTEDLGDESMVSEYQEEADMVHLAERADTGTGTVENPAVNVKYSLGKTLEPGDYMEIHGTYSASTGWFSVNLLDSSGNILIHVNPRPSYRNTVMNSRHGGWQSEVRCELPDLKSYEDFVMKIVLMDGFYKIYFDGKALSRTFPYRKPISTATDIILWGGSNGFKWNKVVLPGAEKADEYTGLKAFELKVEKLRQEIQTEVAGKSLQEVKSYANSTVGSLAIFQWWLLKSIQDKGEFIHFGDETLDWILSNRESLEMFMTSGDVEGDKYKEALKIMGDLIREDPSIKEVPLRLRLAVATAITHSTPVGSMAVPRNKIDWMSMYKTYVRWSQEDVLYPPFFEVTAWHLRYVVGSWQTEEEHIWARENTPEGYDNPLDIGGATHPMMDYKLHNDDGTSVHSGAPYYYYLPVTLKAMHEIGGVCGAISKFAAGMCHAYGVPATPVGQPGHCAYIWYKNGNWQLGNDVSGWGESSTHGGIQYTWMKPAYYMRVMNEAQKDLEGYRISEKMRIASMLANPEDRFQILEDATTECPHNFAVWMDLEDAIEEPNLQKETVQNALLPVVLDQRETEAEVSDIALEKIPTSECFKDTIHKLTDKTGSEAYCREETGEFELDLEKPSTIKELKFQWWGWSKAAEYDIYAMSKDGTYVLVKTQADERVVGWFNHWSYLDGWDMKTTKIKVELRKGKLDPWGGTVYFGLRMFNVIGVSYDVLDDVSKGKPVTANPGSSDPASLVDGTSSTTWNGNSDNSWFEINLKQICALDDIEFFWAEGAKPENVKVTYKVGTGQETETTADDPFKRVSLEMDCGTTVKVELSGGNHVLEGVKACGVEYGAKTILKMKVNMAYEEFYYVRQHLINSIDSMAYED